MSIFFRLLFIKTDFFDKSLDAVSEDRKSDYTDNYFNTLESLKKRGQTGADPKVVAKTIYQVVTNNSNKLLYVPNQTANLLLFLNSITPMGLFSKIL